MMPKIIVLYFSLILITSIKSDNLFFDKPRDVEKCSFSIGRTEDTNIEFIAYIESHCAICAYEQIFEWHDYFIKKNFNQEIVSVKLYVNTDMKELCYLFRDDKVEITVYNDINKEFIIHNKSKTNRTFLLVDNEIKCIGSPLLNKSIDSKCIDIICNFQKK